MHFILIHPAVALWTVEYTYIVQGKCTVLDVHNMCTWYSLCAVFTNPDCKVHCWYKWCTRGAYCECTTCASSSFLWEQLCSFSRLFHEFRNSFAQQCFHGIWIFCTISSRAICLFDHLPLFHRLMHLFWVGRVFVSFSAQCYISRTHPRRPPHFPFSLLTCATVNLRCLIFEMLQWSFNYEGFVS